MGPAMTTFTFDYQHRRYHVPLVSVYERTVPHEADAFVYREGTPDGRYVAWIRCDLRNATATVVQGELPDDVLRAFAAHIAGGHSIERDNEQPRRPRARRGADPVIVPRAVREYVAGERGGRDG